MRKYAIPVLCTTLFAGVVGATAWASSLLSAFGSTTSQLLTAEASPAEPEGPVLHKLTGELLTAGPELAAQSGVAEGAESVAITSLGDLAGDYVQSYLSLGNAGYPGGCGVSVSVSGDDEISITNFYFTSSTPIVLKGSVDLSKKTVTFPAQLLFTDSNYGEIWAATCTSDGTPDYDTPLSGSIGDDGSISISSWWGAYVKEGTYAGAYYQLAYATKFERANATMSLTNNGSTTTFAVRATQSGVGNVVYVKNFFNYGQTVEVLLNGDRTATIPSQTAYYATAGGFATIGNATLTDGQLSYTPDITTTAAASSDNRTLSWSGWGLMTSGNFIGTFGETTITTDFDLNYEGSDFDGAGTASSPYLIKTVDDLKLFAEKVNSDDTYLWPVDNSQSPYSRVYMGRYFRLESDLDLTDVDFTTIANATSQRFAGEFDGNGHTISGLVVNRASGSYAGLFGFIDESGVVKNLKIAGAKVQNTGDYTGVVAAVSFGTIEGCSVTDATVYGEGEATAGIAGVGNVVRDCHVVNSTIYALGGFGGGIAGEIDEEISDCSVEGTGILVSASSSNLPTGGVVGSLNRSTATNCYFSGKIDAETSKVAATVGGVVGASTLGTISQCYALGDIRGYGSSAIQGGVIGLTYGATIQNSYFAGHVADASSTYTGGLVGRVAANTSSDAMISTIKSSYTASSVVAQTYLYDAEDGYRELVGVVDDDAVLNATYAYFDRKLTDFNSKSYGSTTAELTAAAGPDGFDSSVWVFAAGQYPRLKGMSETESAFASASAILFDDYNSLQKVVSADLSPLGNTAYKFYVNGEFATEGHHAKIVDNSKIVATSAGQDTLYVVNDRVQIPHYITASVSYWEGKGSEDSPYLISDKDDLLALATATSVNGVYYPNTYFKFTNDIDFEGDSSFTGICVDASDADACFAGVIDGAGYTIHNLKYVSVIFKEGATTSGLPGVDTSNSKGYKGLVGRLDATGVVKNLTFAADCSFTCFATSAPFVGQNKGTVENCRNYAHVIGYSSNIGGIVGSNEKTGKITNCYNGGDIDCNYQYVGGIAGSNRSTIENCMNTGDITIERFADTSSATATTYTFAGGIAGGSQGGTYRNVVNMGAIHARSKVAGGIVGTFPKVSTTDSTVSGNNDIDGAVNYGVVTCGDATLMGAIAGAGTLTGGASSEGTLKNVYYDSQLLPFGAVAASAKAGFTGVATAKLVSGEALEGLSTDDWQFDAGKYPVLKQFANEERAARGRSVVLTIPEGSDVDDLKVSATLSQADGLSWKLNDGTYYTIDGGTLKSPESVTSVVTDTLVATYGDYVKNIVVKAVPGNPLTGAGTEADPYLISTTDDWTNFVGYMSDSKNTFEGEYLKLANDIDFKGIDFNPCAIDGITSFMGCFDGAGHTMSGINYTTTNTYQGVFGIVGATATIKNLTLEGAITTAKQYTGAFAGKMEGALENCVNRIAVTSTAAYTSGFVAMGAATTSFTKCVNKATITSSQTCLAGFLSTTTASGAKFEDCVNEGEIYQTGTAANTAGFCGKIYPATFVNCSNVGKITAKTVTNPQYMAGLVALLDGKAGEPEFVFTNCYNTADITGKAYLGGLIASSSSTVGATQVRMTDCYNTGNITAAATTSATAPTAGLFAKYCAGVTITRCYNTGDITSVKNVYAGGIVGLNGGNPTAAYPAVIEDCYNTGKITASGGTGGGIAASVPVCTTVRSCWNSGKIEGTRVLGGIAGNVGGATSVLEKCWNIGDVDGTLNCLGGLIGTAAVAGTTVTDCWNAGNVTSACTVKGTTSGTNCYSIGGLAGESGSKYTNCVNYGTVTGAFLTGGLIGKPTATNTKIDGCINAGKVVGDSGDAGNIIGATTYTVGTKTTTCWNENNSVTNSYYLSDAGSSDVTDHSLGEAITTAALAKADLGTGWTSADDYSLPIREVFADDDAANLYSAQVIGKGDDTLNSITGTFSVGRPDGLVWTADQSGLITIIDNDVFVDRQYAGTLTMTATLGDYSKSVVLTLDVATGIDSIDSDNDVVETTYYSVAGYKVAKPDAVDGKTYIAVVKYADGTVKTLKVLNK